jgi:hypothetical protein
MELQQEEPLVPTLLPEIKIIDQVEVHVPHLTITAIPDHIVRTAHRLRLEAIALIAEVGVAM